MVQILRRTEKAIVRIPWVQIKFPEFSPSFPDWENSLTFPGFPDFLGLWAPCYRRWNLPSNGLLQLVYSVTLTLIFKAKNVLVMHAFTIKNCAGSGCLWQIFLELHVVELLLSDVLLIGCPNKFMTYNLWLVTYLSEGDRIYRIYRIHGHISYSILLLWSEMQFQIKMTQIELHEEDSINGYTVNSMVYRL